MMKIFFTIIICIIVIAVGTLELLDMKYLIGFVFGCGLWSLLSTWADEWEAKR